MTVYGTGRWAHFNVKLHFFNSYFSLAAIEKHWQTVKKKESFRRKRRLQVDGQIWLNTATMEYQLKNTSEITHPCATTLLGPPTKRLLYLKEYPSRIFATPSRNPASKLYTKVK